LIDDRLEEIRKRMRRIIDSGDCGRPQGTPDNENICSRDTSSLSSDGVPERKSLEIRGPRPTGAMKRLEEALMQKVTERKSREADLASPYYANDEWTQKQIACLKEQIERINQYLCAGASLSLPRCCASGDFICLIAITGFDSCIMQSNDCGFSLSVGGSTKCRE